jgi:competence protein ComEC
MTLRGDKALAAARPGAFVRVVAVLRPPPEPSLPHGYDFARWAYFQSIGGVGFAYGAPRILQSAPPPRWGARLSAAIEDLRLAMTARITRIVPGPDGAIAAALITGARASIAEDDESAYRDSGLAHVLSISGVHLALAGLGIFWLLRLVFAAIPALALRYPIKKWAALAAFGGASFYLAISGGGSPAVRSYLMLSAMLAGVLFDRPALSMRAVTMAALAILAYEPEDIVDPSFQMSFAAVAGLIALAEFLAARPRIDGGAVSRVTRGFGAVRRYVTAGLATSLVATLATTPFAIYHFDRAAAYSLLANGAAEPLVAFVIMPMAATGVVLMPLGLEAWPLKAMGWGVHAMTAIAHGVAGLPGAATLVRAWPASALIALVLGGLWIALWQKPWRWFGFVPMALGCAVIAASAPPDLFIARGLDAVAVRAPDGRLVILGPRPDDYTARQWLARDGDRRTPAQAQKAQRCDDMGCVTAGKDGRLVALTLRAGGALDDCAHAQIVIAAVALGQGCRGPVLALDRIGLARGGAASVTFGPGGAKVETVAASRGNRPWSRAPQ